MVSCARFLTFFALHKDVSVKRSKLQEDMSQVQPTSSRVCYLRNLSYECTPQEIAALFGQWQPTKVRSRRPMASVLHLLMSLF